MLSSSNPTMVAVLVFLAAGEHELVCRATDDAGGTQPADVRAVWNVKGYANNSWDRVRLRIE